MQNVIISTQPLREAVTVTECKQFMRVDSTDEDDLITDLIVSAREMCESHLRRKVITTGITMTLDGFATLDTGKWWDGVRDGAISELLGSDSKIVLPFPPAVAVTSITTYGTDDSPTVFSSSKYRLDLDGNISLNDGETWPTGLRRQDAVQVIYTCGYGDAPSNVPSAIRHAIKMTVAAMYDDRACFSLPMGAVTALAPYRIMNERSNGV